MLESPHTPEIKEQALCIIGNIAAGAGITDYVMENERILKKLFDFIVSLREKAKLFDRQEMRFAQTVLLMDTVFFFRITRM